MNSTSAVTNVSGTFGERSDSWEKQIATDIRWQQLHCSATSQGLHLLHLRFVQGLHCDSLGIFPCSAAMQSPDRYQKLFCHMAAHC